MTQIFHYPSRTLQKLHVKSWPSCPRKFSPKDGQAFNVKPGQDFNVSFSLPILITPEVEITPRNPHFYSVFLRNWGLVSEEAVLQKNAKHVKGPPFSDEIIAFKKTSERKPQKQQKHRNKEKPKELKQEREMKQWRTTTARTRRRKNI